MVNCHAHTTLEDFATALLVGSSPPAPRSTSPLQVRTANDYFLSQPSSGLRIPRSPRSPNSAVFSSPGGSNNSSSNTGQAARIANVVLAKHLDRAPKAVQIQALELLRTRRIFTRTAVQAAPKQFLFMAVVAAASGGEARVTPHLNDFFYIAHWHDPEDGFANLEEEEGQDAETASMESVVKKPETTVSATRSAGSGRALLSESDVAMLAKASQEVNVDVDVLRYQMNVVSFLRMHRAVAGGISPTATKHLEQLMRCLAPLHRLDYVTPALVALAAKKVYLHRIRIVAPEKERSMQWGSELAAIEAILEDVGPEDVIEDVLGMVAAPL